MRFFTMMFILLVATGLIGWLNYLLLKQRFSVYRQPAVRYTYLLITAAAVVVMIYTRRRNLSPMNPDDEIFYWLLYLALAWLFGQLVLILLQLLCYVTERLLSLRQPKPAAPYSGQPAITRRSFLTGLAAVLPLISVGTGAKGIYEAQAEMLVQQYRLTFSNLPASLQNFKIGQISDTHLGPYFSLDRLDTVIRLIKEQKPDVLAITGDFADDLRLLKPALARLDQLQPFIPCGIYFCIGNHEYIRDIERFRAEVAKSKAVLLENDSQLIVAGAQPLYLLGVDYPGSDVSRSALDVSVTRRLQCFAAASKNIPASAFKILLAHHPDFLIDGFAAQIPLTLAGHTHGGQLNIGGRPLVSNHLYMRGLYQENGVYGYVSSGAGHWFPFRLGCPPEISMFTLTS
ncbi:metallophosphoesterase [Sporomusa termitida]|uniref:Calcineurin-like phosphoeSPTERase n=1 Tax=Sporomusa termitida TaxID=2377 RepID=A0A517DXZ0_9FIRM|nr:metallophosphoesterase [Sporomusa termitida]QDR82227.1 Calcineurin-like phosphoeSPTERase [Sporomusa termitida]